MGLQQNLGIRTHRELASSRQDVDGVLLLADGAQTGSAFGRRPLLPAVLQRDAQSEVLRQVVHGGVGRRLHVPEDGEPV